MTLLSTHHHNHKGNKQVFQWFWDLDNISEPFQHHVETSTKLPLKNFIDRDSIEGLKPKFIFLTTHNMEEPTNITLAKLFKTTCGIGSERLPLFVEIQKNIGLCCIYYISLRYTLQTTFQKYVIKTGCTKKVWRHKPVTL